MRCHLSIKAFTSAGSLQKNQNLAKIEQRSNDRRHLRTMTFAIRRTAHDRHYVGLTLVLNDARIAQATESCAAGVPSRLVHDNGGFSVLGFGV